MKRILFFLIPNFAFAQSNYIAPSVSFAKTSIYNKEDVKHDLLPSKTTYTPAFGVNFGKEKNGAFYEIGIGYNPTVQKYKGWYYYPNDVNNIATATKKLNYLQIPVLIGKSFLRYKKIRPFIQSGLNFNYLLSYSSRYHADYNNNMGLPPVGFVDYIQKGTLIKVDHNNGQFYANYSSSEWYFKKLVLGANLNLGVDYDIKSNLKLRISSNNHISLTNPENNSSMDFIIDKGNGDPLFMGLQSNYNPYERYSGIIGGRLGLTKRSSSILISNGISISLKYLLKNKGK